MGLLIPSAYFFIAFWALWQSYRDPQVPLIFLTQSATAIVFFAIFVALGFLLSEQISLSSSSRLEFYLNILFGFSWGILAMLWLVRKMPQTNVPSLWILRPFDQIDRYLLQIAGLCVLIPLLG